MGKYPRLKIVNKTGIANDTECFDFNGVKIEGITKIEICIIPDNLVQAKLTFDGVEFDMPIIEDVEFEDLNKS